MEYYLNESINASIRVLEGYVDNSAGTTLEYFEELLGSPGTLMSYGYGEFQYVWITPQIIVQVFTDPNNLVFMVLAAEALG
jgi:hypothetical protein